MAMEINGNYNYRRTDHEESLKARQQEKADGVQREREAGNDSEGIPVPKDEYISSERSGRKPSGLYRLGQDENGSPKVLYDDPKKPVGADKGGSPERAEEECTGNTDQVDREIEKLKEKKQQLEQQIKMASGDEEKVRELEDQLAQVENELSRKDNDTYRRQHSVFTETKSI